MSHDTVVHRLVRPGVRALAPTGVTPNQLTMLRLVTGVAAAAAFARGGVLWPDLGAGLFLVSMLLDRADGELARLTRTMSQGGYRLDLVCDCVATAASFIGMGIGSSDAFGATSLPIGVVAAISVTAVFWQINVVKLGTTSGYADAQGRVLVDADDALLAAPFLIWFGWMSWVVALAAAATPVIALALLVIGARRRRSFPRPADRQA